MSGIVGLLNLDGAPVDSELLSRMTESLRSRGPDDSRTWVRQNAGLGHTLLNSSLDHSSTYPKSTQQPLSLDGHIWITADARIDGQTELLSKLAANVELPAHNNSSMSSNEGSKKYSDEELILLAYHAWGEGCVKHLIGDFAFAIWDSLRRRLFCARDHFGIKPFYYVATAREFLFSSSPTTLRLHPAVSAKLNDTAIGDYLLFDMNIDPASSAFADIRRLPPGHSLTMTSDGPKVQAYWTLPLVDELNYKDRQEYVDQFCSLMKTAVDERMRGGATSIFLSGGLDSSVVSTFACDGLDDVGRQGIKAFTYVYDQLMPDQERHFSYLVSKANGIRISYASQDKARLYAWPRCAVFHPPEIINEPLRGFFCDFIAQSAEHSRIVLTGDGGDALLYPEDNYVRKVATRFGWKGLVDNLTYSYSNYGRLPRVGLRSSLLGLRRKKQSPPQYPAWINSNFEKKVRLRERWEQQLNRPQADVKRRRTYESLRNNMWVQLFADYDPDTTGSAVEFRYPFFDLRVVNFLLSLPSLPWCFEKGLLRAATTDQLPAEIRQRPKTQIVRDPILTRVEKPEWVLEDHFHPVDALSTYVKVDDISRDNLLREPTQIWMNTRPLGLNFWLRSL